MLWVFCVLSLLLSCSPGTQLVLDGECFGLEAALCLCLAGLICSGRSPGRLRKRNSFFIAKLWDQNFLECSMIDLWKESHSGQDLSNSRCGSLWRMGRSAGILGGVVMGQAHPWGKYHRVRGTCAQLLPSGTGHLKQRGKDAEGAQSTSFVLVHKWEWSWHSSGSHREKLRQVSWESSETEALPEVEQQEKLKHQKRSSPTGMQRRALENCWGLQGALQGCGDCPGSGLWSNQMFLSLVPSAAA